MREIDQFGPRPEPMLSASASKPQSVYMRSDSRLMFDANTCLSRRFPDFPCEQCVSACPTAALIATGRGPHLAEGCVDCGQCLPRCPTGALSLPGFAAVRPLRATAKADPLTIDCWRVANTRSLPGGLRVPCLGGLSSAWLLELMVAAPGRPVHLLDRGLCAPCPAGGAANRHGTHPATWVLQETKRLLAGIGLEVDLWPRLLGPATSRSGQAKDAAPSRDQPEPLLEARLSRRAFFTGVRVRTRVPFSEEPQPPSHLSQPDQQARIEPRRLSEQARRLAALRRLASSHRLPGLLFPAISIGPGCDQHGLCARACPSGALQLTQRPGEQGHRFSPSDCSACGLCVQLCPTQAIVLHPQGAPGCDAEPRMLSRFRATACPVCGTETPGADPLCPNCARDQAFAQSAFRTLFAARGADP